jgi:hypothetical protein
MRFLLFRKAWCGCLMAVYTLLAVVSVRRVSL